MLKAKMLETTSFAAMVWEGFKIRISVGCGLLFLDAEAEQKTTITASRRQQSRMMVVVFKIWLQLFTGRGVLWLF